MIPTLQVLDEFSKEFTEEIVQRYPSWSRHATVNNTPDGSPCCLNLQVPCPPGSIAQYLRVTTCDGEIMVSFDDPQTEFGGLSNEEALSMITDLVSQRACIAVIKAGELWVHSEIVADGEEVELEKGQAVKIYAWGPSKP